MLQTNFLKIKKLIFFCLALSLLTFLTGCDFTIGREPSSTVTQQNGRFFKSSDGGKTWQARVALATVDVQAKSIANVDIKTMALDPQDNNALYLGTVSNGLYYTYDSAESWQPAAGLNRLTINAIAVDPTSKCVIYAAAGNKALKSTDCSRSWTEAYFDTRVQQEITALAIDPEQPTIVYLGTSIGDLIKSVDRGKSWSALQRFDSQINRLLIDPSNSKIIYAATAKKGIRKTVNGGQTWLDLSEGMKGYSGGREVGDLVIESAKPANLIAASRYGLLKTVDGGLSWTPLALLTPPNGATIYSLGINPQNSQEIYYSTSSTFYRTTDGGRNWATQKLPSKRAATAIIVDPQNNQTIYIGMKQVK